MSRSPISTSFRADERCEHCIWHMSGAWKKRPGERFQEVWCGAGWNKYFFNGGTCPNNTPRIALAYALDSHNWLTEHYFSDDIRVDSEVYEWIKLNQPSTRIDEKYSSDGIVVDFVSDIDAVAFRLRWG